MGQLPSSRRSCARRFLKPDRDRTGALRSCCYSVASIARVIITTNELVTAIAQRAGCNTEIARPRSCHYFSPRTGDYTARESSCGIAFPLKVNMTLLVRSAKKSGKRFPVASPFSKNTRHAALGSLVMARVTQHDFYAEGLRPHLRSLAKVARIGTITNSSDSTAPLWSGVVKTFRWVTWQG